MITEDYCSYEVAKLLKEKGFNEMCNSYFISDNEIALLSNRRDFNNHGIYLSAPTLQMATKWLRIKYNILLFLLPAQENGKLVYLVEVWTWNEEEGIYESTYASMSRKEPEQAVEAALKHCLENLI